MTTSTTRSATAVVIGGSIGGLLAAAAAARSFARVVVVERDALPAQAGPRPGTPQALHTHGLLASGRAAMEQLLPGFSGDLVQQGALCGDVGDAGPWWIGGYRVLSAPISATGLLVSRPVLEAYLRARVRDLSNVTVLDRTDVHGLSSARAGEVTGVLMQDLGDPSAPEESLDADLVIDTTGRPGRASRWFEEHGWQAPAEERVVVGVRYRTMHVAHRESDLDGARIVVSAATSDTPRAGVALRQEDGSWVITIAGYLELEPPETPDGLREFARGLVAPEIAVLLERELLGEPLSYRFPHCVRRAITDATLPQGYAVLGDAICSFNPIFGQGMSVAALQAVALGEQLVSLDRSAALPAALRRYHKVAAGFADHAWTLSVGVDLSIPGVKGRAPRGQRAVSAYLARAQRAAAHDPYVARALLRVVSLLDPPPALMRPAIAAHVVRSGGTHGNHPRRDVAHAASL